MADEAKTTDPAYERHIKTMGEITVEHAAAILANGTRAALHGLSGEDPNHRLMTLAAFLFYLCQVEPERRQAMAAILDGVKDAVTNV